MKQAFTLWAGDPERSRIASNIAAALGALASAITYRVTIEQYVKSRTSKQNATLFAVAYKPIMDWCGLAGEDERMVLHRYWCGRYWGTTKTPFGNKPKRTTTRNEKGEREVIGRQEFAEFYDFIVREAVKIGCVIPDPNPWRTS